MRGRKEKPGQGCDSPVVIGTNGKGGRMIVPSLPREDDRALSFIVVDVKGVPAITRMLRRAPVVKIINPFSQPSRPSEGSNPLADPGADGAGTKLRPRTRTRSQLNKKHGRGQNDA